MADLGNVFDPTKVDPQGDMKPIPVGEYTCVIADSEVKTTKDGTGRYLKLKVQVVDGEFKGRFLWDNINLWNKSTVSSQIAQERLSAVCYATGFLDPIKDSSLLHGKPLRLRVKLRDYNGTMQNEIQSYISRNDAAVQDVASDNGNGSAPGTEAEVAPWK